MCGFIGFISDRKRIFEKLHLNPILDKFCSKDKNFKQTSGFNFVATK